MVKNTLLIFSLLISFNITCQAMQNQLKRDDECTIVSGYLLAILPPNSVVEIDKVLNIENIIGNCLSAVKEHNAIQLPEKLVEYVSICVQNENAKPSVDQECLIQAIRALFNIDLIHQNCRGVFYRGTLKNSGQEYFLHPSWLKKID